MREHGALLVVGLNAMQPTTLVFPAAGGEQKNITIVIGSHSEPVQWLVPALAVDVEAMNAIS